MASTECAPDLRQLCASGLSAESATSRIFAPGSLEPAAYDHMTGRPNPQPSASGYGDYKTTLETVAGALKPGPYILGDTFSAADVIVGSHLTWGMMVKALPERPDFMAYSQRLKERPAWQRAMAKNQQLYAELHPKKAG